MIPDSMRLQNYDRPLELREYGDPSPVYQNKFKGRKVAIKVVWFYVPQKLDEPLSVSPFFVPMIALSVEEVAEILQGSCHVETSSSPKYSSTHWRNDRQE